MDTIVLHRQQHLNQATLTGILDALHLVGQRLEFRRSGRRHYGDDAGKRFCFRRIDRCNPTPGNGAADHHAMMEVLEPMFGREARASGDFKTAVHAGQRLTHCARLERDISHS